MLQVLQHQKSGEIIIDELPPPQCFPNGILVETSYSLISAGTEKTSVDNAKSSLLERAKKQPDQVKLVLDFIKKEGLFATLDRVKAKLDSYKTLGYSASGVVIESDCPEFNPGDRVAIAGAGYANHSEICAVPKNLAVKVPTGVELQEAAFATVAAIALQGIRRAEVQLGENIAVIGLGLIGQITVQLLKANGANVVGFDIDQSTFPLAQEFGCQSVYPSSREYLKEALSISNANGFDSVIITASTSSNEPVEFAIDLARKRGKIIIVGAVGMHIARDIFYRKELELRIATSYGPGRYDPNYEELGNDYPLGFVRWTENRNMQAIIDLLSTKTLDFKKLVTHNFSIQDATTAYKYISGELQEKYLGILINYPERESKVKQSVVLQSNDNYDSESANIGFIGAGIFAQNYLLPNLKKNDVEFISIANSSSLSSYNVAKLFEFKKEFSDGDEVIKDPDVNLIFCATRHNSHSHYVNLALKNKKPIFIEKPLCIDEEELYEINDNILEYGSQIMVGFNRRFSPAFQKIDKFFQQTKEPMNMIYRVNAGAIPKDHWVQLPENGGRIIGEVCHFIDTMSFISSSLPKEVFAISTSTSRTDFSNFDNVSINIKFLDGSVGTIIYSSMGDSSMPKEYFEVFCEGKSAIMDNFKTVKLFRGGKESSYKFDGDKGIENEINEVIKAVKTGKPMPININSIIATTKATFAAVESLKTGEPVELKINEINF